MTPVSGIWEDGDRQIALEQTGPFVRGRCARQGGHETYGGLAIVGRVWLSRRDYGTELLSSMGFSPDRAELVSGLVFGRFAQRLSGNVLTGLFRGTRFTFEGQGPERVQTAIDAPSPRTWRRIG